MRQALAQVRLAYVEPEDPTFIDLPEFARRVGLSVHTVRTMVRDHRIAAVKTSAGRGGTWLVPVSEIARLHEEAQAWRWSPDAAPEVEPDANLDSDPDA